MTQQSPTRSFLVGATFRGAAKARRSGSALARLALAGLFGAEDLWAAAVILYEMLTGRTPFSGGRAEFLVRRDQVDARPPPVRAFLPQALPIVDVLFARALAKNPAERFESAIEMGDAFRTALGLPETPEWRAQADIASAARTIVDTVGPDSIDTTQDEQSEHKKRIATLREFVAYRYKTTKLDST